MSDDVWAQEQEDSIERGKVQRRRNNRFALALLALFLVLGASGPAVIGLGPFGLNSCNAQGINVWVYNPTSTPATMTARYRAPLAHTYAMDVEPMGIGRLFFDTGTRAVEVKAGSYSLSREIAFTNHALITVGGATCFAVFDMSAFYDDARRQPDTLEIIARIPAGQDLYISDANVLIAPRQNMPRRAGGVVHWVEDFDCGLMDPSAEDVLLMRAQTKLENREQELQDAQPR